MPAIDEYLRESSALETENKVSRLLAKIENSLNYDELVLFKSEIEKQSKDSQWYEAEQFWLQKLESKLSYMPENVRSDFSLVEQSGIFKVFSSNSDGPRRFLICFSGRFGGLMIPTWVFLSHLPLTITDVLVIDSPHEFGSTQSVRFKSDWADILQKYREFELSHKPVETYAYGVSGGAAAAVLFSKTHAVSKVMLVAPASIQDHDIRRINSSYRAQQDPHPTHFETKAHFIVGLRDPKALRQIPAFYGLFEKRSFTFSLKAGHGVIGHLYRTKRLAQALSWFASSAKQ